MSHPSNLTMSANEALPRQVSQESGASLTPRKSLSRTLSLPANLEDNDTSHLPPLQRFTRAKQDIITVFTRLGNALKETAAYLAKPRTYLEHRVGLPSAVHELEYKEEKEQIEVDSVKCKGITEAVSRNVMKVVFVGRTSNGKSTSINAMLHAKVLPSSIGNTTNCFLRLNGIEEDQPYVLLAPQNERREVADLNTLSNALFPEHHMTDASVIDVFWPREKCCLLKDDVHIIDSPGLDVSNDFDEWIDQHCMDADVFVLVSNSESTLNMTEKKFFHRVTQKLSKPNVFIEYNRWDCVDQEDNAEIIKRVRAQHEKNAEALFTELQLLDDPRKVQNRVFFVSAREVVNYRSKNPDSPFMGTGLAVERFKEFERFEQEFEKCISASAIKTRFMHHAREGLNIAVNLDKMVSKIAADARDQHQTMTQFLASQQTCLRVLQNNRAHAIDTCRAAIDDVADSIRSIVLSKMQEIVRERLLGIVADFKVTEFSLGSLGEIKMLLNTHVEHRVHSALKQACDSIVRDEFTETQKLLHEEILKILPFGTILSHTQLSNPLGLTLDCSALTENFREDLAFRFSLNFNALLPQAAKANVNEAMNTMGVLLPVGFAASIREDTPWTLQRGVMLGMSFCQSPAGWITIGLGSFFLKRAWGWAIVGGTTAVVGIIYAFERFFYKKDAVEKKFRLQYIDHVSKELNTMARQTSIFARQNSHRELSRLLDEILGVVSKTESHLKEEIDEHEKELVELQATAAKAEELHRASKALAMDFDNFLKRYINTNEDEDEAKGEPAPAQNSAFQ